MPAGENPPSSPDTLASLRRKSRPKLEKSRPTQPDLFSTAESAPAPESKKAVILSAAKNPHIPASATVVPVEQERRIYSVRALVADIRQHTESAYSNIWVEGEISNCRPAASGHVYFTLKDGEAQLPIVLFRRQAQLLRFRPQDGLAVLVRGRISVYESRGQLQLIAETMEPRGAGALQLAFEQLKRRLADEGLFDAARKRPLPPFPHCIGVVTSPTGAVIRDIVTVVRRRHARLNLLIYPALMQGTNSPQTVIDGIAWFNAHPDRVDLIVIARGGGSLEDLAAFNDESLARAIAASELPIVSAIGHETDFTIADFVADLRAPTPSAAAELITAAQHRIEDRVHALTTRLQRAVSYSLMQSRQRYARLSADSVLMRLRDSLYRREQHLDDLAYRADSALHRRLRSHTARLTSLTARLQQQAPTARLALTHRRLDRVREALIRIGSHLLDTRRTRLASATTRLHALSPLAVLNRGYALIYAEPTNPGAPHLASEMWDSMSGQPSPGAPPIDSDGWDENISPASNGTLLRNAADVKPGQRIRARLATGTLTATVLETHE
ncbi:exodeoxyribonuclease VII large subunit [Granulicella aggregans]|uniref:exodeoxyribonuclease VII large subunit n=1 Tax=Granulicella aggregans TaxID=474949 RepID=UPI0021E0E86A|nr:exodeoxyribonuclease VII large subunit [Granulicella aggregans]